VVVRGVARVFRWRDLHAIGKAQLLPAPKEEHVRTCINRAYYAAFGEAKEFAIAHGYVFQRGRGGSHDQVWQFLRRASGVTAAWQVPAWRAIGDAGLDLRDRRTNADYFLDRIPNVGDASIALAQSRTIISRLAGLP
jgi:hypothetical protein